MRESRKRMIPLPKGSLYYFHRVMNLNHTSSADWREVQPQLSLGFFSSSEMTSSSSGWLDSLLRGLNELVDWEVLTSLGTEVLVVLNEGLSSVPFRKNEWVSVDGAWGLLLLDGMILTKSNIQRQRGWKYVSEMRSNITLKMTLQQSNAGNTKQ